MRGHRVVGDLAGSSEVPTRRKGMVRLEGVGDRAMDGGTLGREQLGFRSFSRERVPERIAGSGIQHVHEDEARMRRGQADALHRQPGAGG